MSDTPPPIVKCAHCAGGMEVLYVTPDMDIKPVPLCLLCRVVGFDWQEKMGVKAW